MSTATKAVIIAALALALAGDDSSTINLRITRNSLKAAKRLIKQLKRLYGFDSVRAYGTHYEAQLAQKIADTARSWSRDHSRTMQKSGLNAKRDPKWTEAASRTMATNLMSEALVNMSARMSVAESRGDAPPPQLTNNVRKVWMSRGDLKVRHTHRKLHGATKALQTPFKSWKTGEVLSFPGDMRAPLSETINCRCFLWVSLTDKMPSIDSVPVLASMSQELSDSLWLRELSKAERELLHESSARAATIAE